MLGPLPRLHRLSLFATALAVFVGLGLVVGATTHVPLLVTSGATLGVLLGLVAAWLLVHEPHRAHLPHRHHWPRS